MAGTGGRFTRLALAGGILAALAQSGSAYKIGGPFPSLHERMATMSAECLVGDGAVVPDAAAPPSYGSRIQCPFDTPRLHAARKATPKRLAKQTMLEVAARWGDDPGRGLRNLTGTMSYGWKIGVSCDKIDFDRATIYDAGLMCSGHYGEMGFLHAMMSSNDTAPDPADEKHRKRQPKADAQAQTYAKILAWAEFTYRVAAGDLTPDRNICAVMRNDRDFAVLRATFDDDKRPGTGIECGGAATQWTIGRFFTFACANPRSNRRCAEQPDPGHTLVRWSAIGSLFHMLQDSYAQGHAVRRGYGPIRDAKGKMIAVIACAAPTQFFFYDHDNQAAGHGTADFEPVVDLSCDERTIDDPVSVGATILWMLREKRSAADFRRYLQQRVLGTAPPAEPQS